VYGLQNSGNLHIAGLLIAEISYKHGSTPHNDKLMSSSHHHKILKQGCCPTIIIMQDTTTNPSKRDMPGVLGAIQKLMVASRFGFLLASRTLASLALAHLLPTDDANALLASRVETHLSNNLMLEDNQPDPLIWSCLRPMGSGSSSRWLRQRPLLYQRARA
jgi:hypothetical protein